jgi:uncharacterized protein (TIGR02996 family)
MLSDDNFLAQLQTDPAANDTRLVYADWLEERGDPASAAKAEFLRVTVELAAGKGPKRWRKAREKRLQQLAAGLDTDWLAVVSRLAVENCHRKQAEAEPGLRVDGRFDFLCERRWEGMRPTDDPTVRFCDSCRHNVYCCDTIGAARRHAWDGHCIAVDLGVIRRKGDLEAPTQMLSAGPARPGCAANRSGCSRTRCRPSASGASRRKPRRSKGRSRWPRVRPEKLYETGRRQVIAG